MRLLHSGVYFLSLDRTISVQVYTKLILKYSTVDFRLVETPFQSHELTSSGVNNSVTIWFNGTHYMVYSHQTPFIVVDNTCNR